jgi:hypothetical protein
MLDICRVRNYKYYCMIRSFIFSQFNLKSMMTRYKPNRPKSETVFYVESVKKSSGAVRSCGALGFRGFVGLSKTGELHATLWQTKKAQRRR